MKTTDYLEQLRREWRAAKASNDPDQTYRLGEIEAEAKALQALMPLGPEVIDVKRGGAR